VYRRYPDELRAEVVTAVIEGGMTYAGAARRFGMVDETVRNWVDAARRNPDGSLHALDATNRERIADLERRLGELEHDNARVERAAVAVVGGLIDRLRPWMAALLSQVTEQPAVADLPENAWHEA
jgi:transposase